jgi:hypothetical protein
MTNILDLVTIIIAACAIARIGYNTECIREHLEQKNDK